MLEPESISPGSIMPPYPWLIDQDIDTDYTSAKIRVLKMLNTPYPDGFEDIAVDELKKQAEVIADELREQGVKQKNLEDKEIVALIAYLQRLGTDIKPKKLTETK
jgi:cytochrome c oxidase cbb3-type subunit I/II